MRQRILYLTILIMTGALFSSVAVSKGLDELSESNPETTESTAPKENEETGEQAEAGTAETTNELKTPATITEKVYLATSFGWVKGSRSEGEWKTSGMGDVTVGYKLPFSMGNNINMFGTYRYAPVAVAGTIDDNSYRGVWEFHYFGALAQIAAGGLEAIATAEIGYGVVFLDSVDGIDLDKKHESNGVSVAIGGGADWELFGEPGFKLGPRLNIGFGGFTTIQLGAAATFFF